jgi:tRNA A-37 threonylcarbamoyl transferase component Bud32
MDLAHSPTLAAPSAEAGERLVAGARAGEYVVEKFVGAGAMGEVYAGRHPVIGKRVAIKVLRRELASSPDAAERFTREARAAGAIDHPNVVDVFAFGRLDDGRLYLVMDFVDGVTLRARLADGPLDLLAALNVLAPIADALDTAHARGVIHRDLKPDNIVVSNAHGVFVLDFGIAKLVSSANDGATGPGTLTGQGTWLGTPGYMAPEQWSADGARAASDRYALGVIAYELLVGKLPFAASSVPQMMEQHFRAEVPAVSASGKTIPPALDPVLRRALAKDPDARYATAREFVDALRAAAGTGVGARAAVAPPEHRSRVPIVPAVAGVAVLGAMIGGVLVLRGGDKRDDDRPTEPAADRGATTGEPRSTVVLDSIPTGAEVISGSGSELDNRAAIVLGKTPVKLEVPADGTLAVAIAKPGYVVVHRTLRAADRELSVRLDAIDRFAGTWRLPRGELRRLERKGDVVDVYKVAAVGEAGTFWSHYAFVGAPTASGVAFAVDEDIVDPRAPHEESCRVRAHVEYRYEPASDALELRRDKVTIDLRDGRCVVHGRTVEAHALERVDRARDAVTELAPAGEIKKLKVVNKPKSIGKTPPPQKQPPPPAKNVSPPVQSEMQAPPNEQPSLPQKGNANNVDQAPAQQQQQQAPQPQPQPAPTKAKKKSAS